MNTSAGFGSLIRAMGSQINKSTNKEACRNLSGRRVRDINAEKKYVNLVSSFVFYEEVCSGADWQSGQLESQREKEERLRRKCND